MGFLQLIFEPTVLPKKFLEMKIIKKGRLALSWFKLKIDTLFKQWMEKEIENEGPDDSILLRKINRDREFRLSCSIK